MKLEIFGEEEEETTIRLSLVREKTRGIRLVAVDIKGNTLPQGNLLTVEDGTGRIVIHRGLRRDLGFDLDESNRIVVEKR